jgi:DNA-binding transcriptional LysR family regulator
MLSIAHQVFLEVAANLSFSKAAQVLFITQPAVSKHIKLLEDQYKVPLFERKGASILLTEAGNMLNKHLLKASEIQRQIAFDISTLGCQYNHCPLHFTFHIIQLSARI